MFGDPKYAPLDQLWSAADVYSDLPMSAADATVFFKGKKDHKVEKFEDPKYAPLDQLWSAADAYLDLAKSAADATEYFKDQKDHEVERLFWSQFSSPMRPLSLN